MICLSLVGVHSWLCLFVIACVIAYYYLFDLLMLFVCLRFCDYWGVVVILISVWCFGMIGLICLGLFNDFVFYRFVGFVICVLLGNIFACFDFMFGYLWDLVFALLLCLLVYFCDFDWFNDFFVGFWLFYFWVLLLKLWLGVYCDLCCLFCDFVFMFDCICF